MSSDALLVFMMCVLFVAVSWSLREVQRAHVRLDHLRAELVMHQTARIDVAHREKFEPVPPPRRLSEDDQVDAAKYYVPSAAPPPKKKRTYKPRKPKQLDMEQAVAEAAERQQWRTERLAAEAKVVRSEVGILEKPAEVAPSEVPS